MLGFQSENTAGILEFLVGTACAVIADHRLGIARMLNLALPPNRKGGQRGFIGCGDDGEGARCAGITASDSHPMAHCSVAPEQRAAA